MSFPVTFFIAPYVGKIKHMLDKKKFRTNILATVEKAEIMDFSPLFFLPLFIGIYFFIS